MGRNRLMTAGVLLILIGAQLYCVRTYYVTPSAAQFVKQRIIEVDEAAGESTAPFFSTAFRLNRTGSGLQSIASSPAITPPSWLKWAALFAGTVLVLQGAVIPK